MKFFPAEAAGGGSNVTGVGGALRPYGREVCPAGGVGPDNLVEYLALPGVSAVGGSWMLERSLIREGRFDEIERLAREAVVPARS